MKPISERDLADKLELPRLKIQLLRLSGKVGFEKRETGKDGRVIVYREAGVRRLLDYLKGEGALISAGLELLNGNGHEPITKEFVVRKVCLNKHLLDVEDEAGNKARLWVRDNHKFVQKMKVTGRPKAHWPDNYFELVGNGPRHRGRW